MPQISPELAEAAKRLHESSTKVYNLADDTTRSPSPLSFPPDSWTKVYNLGEDTTRSPSPLSFPPDVPPAPHLEDCTAKTALRVKAEARGAHGEDPAWVRPGRCCNCTPQPPWGILYTAHCTVRTVQAAMKDPEWVRPGKCCNCTPQPPWVLQLHAPTPLDECFGAAVLLLEDRAQCTVQAAREDPEWVLLCYLASAATAHEFRVDSKLDVSHTAGGSSPVHSASSKDPRVGAVLLGKASAATAQRTPQPPRVRAIRGSDAANLALTRVFQRDLWERQFPASCAGRRLMITDWPPKHHGTGNMVHVMGSFLNAAVRHNRTLVIRPRTFHRASGQECAGVFPQALTPHQAPQHQQHGACDGVVSERRRAAQQDARHPPPHLSPRWRAGVRRCVPPSTHPPSSTTAPATVHVMGSFLNAAVRHNRTLVIRPRTFHRASGQECAGRSSSAPAPFTALAGRSAQVCSPKHSPPEHSYPTHHSTGNMVHVMGSFLNAAVRHNRTLVIRPRTFHRASGQECAGVFPQALTPHQAPQHQQHGACDGVVSERRRAAQQDARHPPPHLSPRWRAGVRRCVPPSTHPPSSTTAPATVHVMGSFLNAAVRHNRTLVIRPRTFHRASGQECAGRSSSAPAPFTALAGRSAQVCSPKHSPPEHSYPTHHSTGNMVHVMGSFLNAAVRHNRTLVIRPRTFHRASGQECAGRSSSAPAPFTALAGRSAQVCSPKHSPPEHSYPTHHSTGNMVHVMGSFLNAAVRHNRTLVIRPRTFHRASGQECAGVFPQALTPHQAPQHQQHGACDGVVSERRRAAQQDARHPPPHLSPRWRAGVRRCVPPSTHPPSSTTAPATVHVMGSFLNAAVRHNRTLVIRPRTFHRASGQECAGRSSSAPAPFTALAGRSAQVCSPKHSPPEHSYPTHHSTGNMVHVMGSFLNAAVRHNRTLVIRPRTFHSASGQECAGRSLSAPAPSTVLAGRSAQVCSPKHSYPTHHGTGNMVHVMGSFLNAAVRHNRTLVIRPRTFHRSSRQAGVCRTLVIRPRTFHCASGGECGVDGYRTGGEYKEGNGCAVLCSAKGRSSSALAPSTALVGGNVGTLVIRPRTFHCASGGECGVDGYRTGGEYKEGNGCAVLCSAKGRSSSALAPSTAPVGRNALVESAASSTPTPTASTAPVGRSVQVKWRGGKGAGGQECAGEAAAPLALFTTIPCPQSPPDPLYPHPPDIRQEGEWECYFFPVASPDCLKVALAALTAVTPIALFPYPTGRRASGSVTSSLSPPQTASRSHIGQEGEWECYFFPVAYPDCLKVAPSLLSCLSYCPPMCPPYPHPPDIGQEGEWECYFFPVAYPDCLKVAPSLLSCLSYCPPMCPPYPHPPDIGQEGEWECYFFPVASPDCLKVALAAEATAPIALFNDTKETVLASAAQVVICNDTHYHHDAARAASLWVAPDGRPPELEHPFTIEQLGRIWVPNDNHIGERWWRSQTARFLLRWPSALLCHITNRVRHNTYGMAVAERVISATAKQQTILHSTPPNTPESQHLNSLPDASSAVPPSVAYKSSLAGTVWQMKGFAGCVGTRCNESEACAGAGSANAGGGAAVEFSSLQDEPFIFRPYVSLHVRLSDKYLEMKLHFFATYMYFMYKLRAHVPNLEHVWLSTEMQSVIEETSNFPDWTFHYTTSGRVTSATQMQEEHVKDKQRTGEIFANLIITTQADYFVGALASNWNRLIDELRSTNGRLYSGHVALNEAWT
ncbi:unnamed protein product [Closterium sp. NIES-64]|nr:unnamed protein product [Closterium sp. NIES-64]